MKTVMPDDYGRAMLDLFLEKCVESLDYCPPEELRQAIRIHVRFALQKAFDLGHENADKAIEDLELRLAVHEGDVDIGGGERGKYAERYAKSVENLSDAVAHVEKNYPLPRCQHGNALRDGCGAFLNPSCGCGS